MEKLKVGILGCGRIGGTMAGTITKMDSAAVYAAASRDLGKAHAFATQYEIPHVYGSYEDMLDDPAVGLVYIATPHSHHYDHIKLCIEHGKNVLCEKSFTVNAEQAEEVLDLAEKKHVLVAEAMWVRFLPLAKTLKEIIASGIIGEISACTADIQYIIDQKERIVEPSLAGGALLDVGVYAMTFASITMGDDIDRIQAAAIMTDKGVDKQDAITILYRDGRMAVLNCGISAISDRQGILYGRKGFIVVENINNFASITIYSDKRELVQRIPAPAQITGYEYEVESCRRAIEAGKIECPEMPHAETIEILRQMDTVRRQIGLKYPFE